MFFAVSRVVVPIFPYIQKRNPIAMPFSWLRSKDKEPPPPFWRDYLAAQEPPLPPETPLAEIPFVVFDTETTGLDLRQDQLLSIGALRVQGWQIAVADSLELYVHQVYEAVPANVAVHGILPVEREGSLEESAAVRRFLAYAGNSVLVGHHVSFDVGMINAVLHPLVGDRLRNPTLDTARLARRLMPATHIPRAGEFSLDALCRQYGIKPNDRHTAAGDALLTALLLLKQLARLEKRGVGTLKALFRRQ